VDSFSLDSSKDSGSSSIVFEGDFSGVSSFCGIEKDSSLESSPLGMLVRKYCGIRLRRQKNLKSNFATLLWVLFFFHYNFLFLTTLSTPRFVLLDERTARKWPNSCRFVLLDEYHSILTPTCTRCSITYLHMSVLKHTMSMLSQKMADFKK
jgi:hypothetical protein